MKKKNKEINYLYGYLDYVINKYDAEFFDYENEFSYILNDKFFKIVYYMKIYLLMLHFLI